MQLACSLAWPDQFYGEGKEIISFSSPCKRKNWSVPLPCKRKNWYGQARLISMHKPRFHRHRPYCYNTYYIYIYYVDRLSAVGSLSITASDSTLSLTWEPPFSLDITNIDPDITGYCVDVRDQLHHLSDATLVQFGE